MHEPISASLVLRAEPAAVFDLLADPRRHQDLDGSGTLRGRVVGPDRLGPGARFGMSMRMFGLPYRMTNRVSRFEPDRSIAWTTRSGVTWRYDLEPTGDGATRVTETWDPSASPAPARVLTDLLGIPARTDRSIRATLEHLRVLVERSAT